VAECAFADYEAAIMLEAWPRVRSRKSLARIANGLEIDLAVKIAAGAGWLEGLALRKRDMELRVPLMCHAAYRGHIDIMQWAKNLSNFYPGPSISKLENIGVQLIDSVSIAASGELLYHKENIAKDRVDYAKVVQFAALGGHPNAVHWCKNALLGDIHNRAVCLI
jgi:hypothetical protein